MVIPLRLGAVWEQAQGTAPTRSVPTSDVNKSNVASFWLQFPEERHMCHPYPVNVVTHIEGIDSSILPTPPQHIPDDQTLGSFIS